MTDRENTTPRPSLPCPPWAHTWLAPGHPRRERLAAEMDAELAAEPCSEVARMRDLLRGSGWVAVDPDGIVDTPEDLAKWPHRWLV